MYENDGNYELVGVTSWGIGCGRPKSPGFYAKVRGWSFSRFGKRIYREFFPSILAVESWWKPIVGEDSELPREESSQVKWGPNVLLITYLTVIGYFA